MMKPQSELAQIAIHILHGVWGNEDEAAGALDLTWEEKVEVRRLTHIPYKELKSYAT